ncbi:hypothetical protein OKW21_004651 [Catalinimonas alkaloidigena]|nr:hypothetical protein [Catalinimonas alkaloidigena]MDF9799388.1 hypothetical protein [Catalinimonas alkaloidigena]
MATNWGFQESREASCARAKCSGYDGLEAGGTAARGYRSADAGGA